MSVKAIDPLQFKTRAALKKINTAITTKRQCNLRL